MPNIYCKYLEYTGCPINMETRSTLIFSFCISATGKVKPLLKSLDPNLQGATLILIFFKKLDYFLGSAKNETKQNLFFWRHASPFFSKCPKFLFPQIHVPGAWNFVSSSNPCTRVPGYMEFCFLFKFMYPGTWIWENKILGHFEKKGVGAEWSQKKIQFCFAFCRP